MRGASGVKHLWAFSKCQWHVGEVFVKINGERRYLWRAVDREGEVLESVVTRLRNKHAALTMLRKLVRRYGRSEVLVTDRSPSYRAALREMGCADLQACGRWLNNHAENSHLPFRRRERAMQRFRRMAPTRRGIRGSLTVLAETSSHLSDSTASHPFDYLQRVNWALSEQSVLRRVVRPLRFAG